MPAILITPPATEPITLAEAKDHLRILDAAQDTLIGAMIKGARQYIETHLGRSLVTQTWELALDAWPEKGFVRILNPPVISITSVTAVQSGVVVTLDPIAYQSDLVSRIPRLAPAANASWPSADVGVLNAIRVRYTAGYGAAAAVPEDIKAAIKFILAHWFENREATVVGTISSELANSVAMILTEHRIRPVDWE